MILSSPSCYRELGGSWHGLPFEAQSTAQIFSAQSTAAYKEFEQRLAMVICHKLYISIQERLWVSILVHDSIRRWILWLFTSTICIPKHQIHATCGGIIIPKQQHKKEMLSFNQKPSSFFCRGILPLPLWLTPLRYPCSLHLPMWPRPCPPAAPPIVLPTAPALPTALLPALPAARLLVSAARLMAPTAQGRKASHQK